MKRLIILMCAVSTIMVAQDAAGQYKLTGVDVLYTFVTRAENILTVTDAYGMGVTVPIATIPAAVPFTTQTMQLTDAALSAIGINLNVTLNIDGSGSIAEGSYYPDVNTITDEEGNCVTLQQVLPVTDNFTYTSMGGLNIPNVGVNVLGLPGISTNTGLGGLGLSGSNTFEDYPMIPEHPVLCGPDGSCFPFTTGDCGFDGDDDDGDGDGMEVECCAPGDGLDGGHCGDGVIQFAHLGELNELGFAEYVAGGVPLTGVSGGLFLKRGLNTDDLSSVYPGNTEPDFILEWHGVDGSSSGLGCGEEDDCMLDETTDEDLDGTWWDRQVGIPAVPASYMNPAAECGGLSQPIFGCEAVEAAYAGTGCYDYCGEAASGYLMDAAMATWSGFMTANAAQFNGCLAATGGDMALCAGTYPQWLANDGDHDFNGVDGRLTMNFDIPCVGIIEAREVIAEFIEVGGGDCGSGDIDHNGSTDVLDIVSLVGCILTASCSECAGDLNGDGGYTVLDVVSLVNCVLNNNCDGGRIDSATSAEFNVIGNEVTMTADGLVGGIQMTLSHGSDFALTLIDGGQFSDYLTEGNTTTLIIVNPVNDNLFTTSGDFTIESVIVSDFTGENRLSASVNMPSDFSISAAYPNPFNPTTQMSLDLSIDANVSVKVFNTMGQLVDVIAEGQMAGGSYMLTWDGTNVSSGIYYIQTEVGSDVQSQKIMLIK